MKRLLATLLLLASITPAAAQWLDVPTPGIPRTADGKPDLTAPAPRTADGKPDLNGLWRGAGTTGDLRDTSKMQPWARTKMAEHERTYYKEGPHMLCLPSGPAFVAGGGLKRIVQSPKMIAVLMSDLSYRQIFMDGRTLEPDPLPIFMGYSVGRWDGDTLVVESNGFNEKTWLHQEGYPHTDKLRITERYRRLDFGHMQLDVTYDDPGTFDSPLHASVKMEFADDVILESVCNEATEGGVKHWAGDKALDNRVTAIKIDPDLLTKYVGTYKGYWLDNMTTAVFTIEDGGLFVQRNGGPKSPLLPQSETTFVCPTCQWGQPYIFSREGDGPATQVSEIQVSGAWIFKRVQ
jgi:hypothetical protein